MSNSSLAPRDNNKSSSGGRGALQAPLSPGYGYYAEPNDSGEGLREQVASFLGLVVRRKWSFLAFLLVTFGSIAAYSFLTTQYYVGRAFVMLDIQESGGTAVPGYADNFQFVQPQRSVEGEILLLKISNPLADRVAGRLIELGTVPGTDQPLSLLRDEIGEPLSRREVANAVGNYVEFEPQGREADVITVVGWGEVGGEAALISNMYAEEYVKLTQEASRAQLSASRRFLEEQEEKWRAELYDAEEAVRAYTGFEGSAALDQKGAFLVDQVATLEAQRDQTNIDLQMRKASITSKERELALVNPQIADRISSSVDQQIEVTRTRIADMELKRSEILLRYNNVDVTQIDHPELKQIDSQLASMRANLTRLSKQYVEEIESTGGLVGAEGLSFVASLRRQVAEERIAIEGLEAQIRTLDKRLGGYLTEMGNLPGKSLQVARLERKREHSTRMYESVVGRLQEILVAEQSQPGYARVIREASVPWRPEEPNIPRNLLLGLLLGMLLGGAAAVISDKIDNRLYDPEWIRDSGYDIIGVIPDMSSLIKSEWRGRPRVEHDGVSVATSLTGLIAPKSAVTEAYRSLRTHIQFSGRDKMIRKILVTSASMGEGKSVTASNIALVMAQAGRKTVLLDLDLRRPRIHTLFGLDAQPGVTDHIANPSAHPMTSFAHPAPNLTVVQAGAPVSNPAEFIGSVEVRELIATLEETYDIVVVDSPPVRAATDSALLSTQCDGTIVVARAAETKYSELELALDEIKSVGGSLLGIVFNGFDVQMAYGYKYLYSNYSQYAEYSSYSEV